MWIDPEEGKEGIQGLKANAVMELVLPEAGTGKQKSDCISLKTADMEKKLCLGPRRLGYEAGY